jgi:hypothetical protein
VEPSIIIPQGLPSVVVLPPGLDFSFYVLQGQKPISVEALVPEAPIEAFRIGMTRWITKQLLTLF